MPPTTYKDWDTDVETLPLWPEALERGQRDSGEMHFPCLQNACNVPPPADLRQDISLDVNSETELVRIFATLIKVDQLGLRLNDWLSSIDAGLKQKTTILFDGLDVGFGSSEPERKRRNSAISGLFDFWMNRESKQVY